MPKVMEVDQKWDICLAAQRRHAETDSLIFEPFYRNKEFPENVNQKQVAKNIADTLLTKQG